MADDTTTYGAGPDAVKRHALRPLQRTIAVRWDDDHDDEGQRLVDEIHAVGMALEMMDDANCWMDVLGLRVWMRAVVIRGKPRLFVTATAETCEEDRW